MPARSASDWSAVRIYPRVLRPIGPPVQCAWKMGIKTEHNYKEAVYAWMVITFDRLLIWKQEPEL
eukprot:4017211-Pyramimonas_sp.AAC.1